MADDRILSWLKAIDVEEDHPNVVQILEALRTRRERELSGQRAFRTYTKAEKMTRCSLCREEAATEFVSTDLAFGKEIDRFGLCVEHKEALYDFMAEMSKEVSY